jgi:hypothetical protein
MKTLLLLTALALTSLVAAEPPETRMTLPGKLLLSESFAEPVTFAKSIDRSVHPGTWTEGWRAMNGTWTQVDGGIRGIVKPKVYPAATLHLPLVYQDAIIEVEVRLDNIPLDDPPKGDFNSAGVVLREGDAAHIASVRLGKGGLSAGKDKTKSREVKGTVVTDDEVSFGKQSLSVKPGEWHTLLIEVRGEEMLATVDGGSPVFGSHPVMGLPKGILSFGTPRSVSYRNLRVFEALPNPAWEANKSGILKQTAPAKP